MATDAMMMLHNKKVDGLLGTKEGEKEGIELEMAYVRTEEGKM